MGSNVENEKLPVQHAGSSGSPWGCHTSLMPLVGFGPLAMRLSEDKKIN